MQGEFDAVSKKQVYPKDKRPKNLLMAEALEDREVTGDRGTPDPEKAEKRRLKIQYETNHPKRGKGRKE